MKERLAEYLYLLEQDISVVLPEGLGLSVVRSGAEQPLFGEPSSAQRASMAGFAGDGLIATARGSTWFVSTEVSTTSSLISLISHVQDEVMSELGYGWPEFYEGDSYLGVLTPGEAGGEVMWCRSDGFTCRIGELASTYRHSIRTVS